MRHLLARVRRPVDISWLGCLKLLAIDVILHGRNRIEQAGIHELLLLLGWLLRREGVDTGKIK